MGDPNPKRIKKGGRRKRVAAERAKERRAEKEKENMGEVDAALDKACERVRAARRSRGRSVLSTISKGVLPFILGGAIVDWTVQPTMAQDTPRTSGAGIRSLLVFTLFFSLCSQVKRLSWQDLKLLAMQTVLAPMLLFGAAGISGGRQMENWFMPLIRYVEALKAMPVGRRACAARVMGVKLIHVL